MKQQAFKFRIYPNLEQQEYFDKCFRTSNFIFNYFLNEQRIIDNMLKMYGLEIKEERNKYKKENKLYFNKFEAANELTDLTEIDRYKFLSAIDSTIRGCTCAILDTSFANMWKTHAGYPKFKNKKSKKTFKGQILYNGKPVPQNFKILKNINKNYFYINIPKIKELKCVIHQQEFSNNWNSKFKINSYTVSKTPTNEYFISLQVENKLFVEPDMKPILSESSIGIDFGVERPITTSDLNDFDNPIFKNRFDILKNKEKELARLNRIISKKMDRNKDYKTSSKYNRIRNKINKLYQEIANQRNDIQHNITRQLVDKPNVNSYILEDLNIKNMTKRAKEKNVKQKSGLNKAILDVAPHALYSKLSYKANSVGKNVIKIDPKYTSMICSACGNKSKENRVSQSVFNCIKCNLTINADYNASINIKNKYFKKDNN